MSPKSLPKLVVARGAHGLGLFTDEEVRRGQLLIEYTGEPITSKEADRRGGRYLFTVSRHLVIDAKGRENKARYINHSCKPNCYAEINEEATKVFIYARRRIGSGLELNYNYGKEYFKDIIGGKSKCKCGEHKVG